MQRQPDIMPGDREHVGAVPAALLGRDHPGLRIRAEVEVGDEVRAGQILFRDRRRPAIAFVSPVAGRVEQIALGARRTLSALVVAPGEGGEVEPAATDGPIRALLLEQGLWPAFVRRPFGGCPDPDAVPAAILVAAVRASSTAPGPADVLAGREAEFTRGLEALTELTDGPVHLCQPPGAPLCAGLPARTALHRVRGVHAPGALVHRHAPAGAAREVWTVGYQDVAAIGHLLATGRHDGMRTVHVAGRGSLRLPLGADLRAVLPDAGRRWSGPPEHGREAAFLGRHHLEVHALPAARPARRGLAPIVPLAGLDRALALGIPAVPLMRALATGDAERCARLGCMALLEEDVAPLTLRCTSGTDYAARLRGVLDDLRARAA